MPRVRPHFKVLLSIATHPNTAAMWGNLEDRAMFCECLRLANQRYASFTSNTFVLSMKDIEGITCVEGGSAASQKFKAFIARCDRGAKGLGGKSPLTTDSRKTRGRLTEDSRITHVRLTIRNLAKRQGFTLKNVTPSLRQERREKKEDISTIESIAISVSERLKNLMVKAQPTCRTPHSLKAWAKVYGLMMRVDGRTVQEIERQQDWLFGANARSEISFVVQSPKSHRDKYDRISLQMNKVSPMTRQRKAREAREEREANERKRDDIATVRSMADQGIVLNETMQALLNSVSPEGESK